MQSAVRGVQKLGAVAVPILVVCALSVYASLGWLARHPADGQSGPVLFLRQVDERTGLVIGLLIYCAVMYAAAATVIGGLLRFTLGRADVRAGEDERTRAPADRAYAAGRGQRVPRGRRGPRRSRLARASSWLLEDWWRLSLLLLVIWSPLLLAQVLGGGAPLVGAGADGADAAAGSAGVGSAGAGAGSGGAWADGPFDGHGSPVVAAVFAGWIALGHGVLGSASAGVAVLMLAQLAVVLIALGRALSLLSRWVRSDGLRTLGVLLLVVGGAPIVLWSLSLSSASLSAAALGWTLALTVDHVRSREHIASGRVVEWALAALIALSCAGIALPIVLVLLVTALVMRRDRRARGAALLALALPLLVVFTGVRVGTAHGVLEPGDPMASRGLQIQSLALALHEEPDALSARDSAALEGVLDLDAMREHGTADTSPADVVTADATEQGADAVSRAWRDLAQDRPGLVADGLLLETAGSFDPFAHGPRNLPASADGGVGAALDGAPGLRLLTEAPLRVVAVLLLAVIAVALRRPSAWVWVLPSGLLVGALVVSPAATSGSPALIVGSLVPFALLALAGSRDSVADGSPHGVPSAIRRVVRPRSSGATGSRVGDGPSYGPAGGGRADGMSGADGGPADGWRGADGGSADDRSADIAAHKTGRHAAVRPADPAVGGPAGGAVGGPAGGAADSSDPAGDAADSAGPAGSHGAVAGSHGAVGHRMRHGADSDSAARAGGVDPDASEGRAGLSWIDAPGPARPGGPQGRHQRSAEAEKQGRYGSMRSLPQRPLAPPRGLHRKPPRRSR